MSHMSIQKKGVSIAQARQLPLQQIGSDNSPVNEIAFQSLKRDNCLSNVPSDVGPHSQRRVSIAQARQLPLQPRRKAGMLLAQQGFQSLKRDNCLSNVFMNHVSAGKSHAFQ